MKHSFVHEFEDHPAVGDFDIDLNLPTGARIQIAVDDGDVWVSANRAGWQHLARICAEMAAHSGFTPGYHFHRTRDWKESEGPPEVSFELNADEA